MKKNVMIMRKSFFALLAAVAIFSSCSNKSRELQLVNFRGVVFGTYYSVAYYSPDGRSYQASIDSLFGDFNQSVSYYDPNSVVSRINRNETTLGDDYFITVLRKSLEIAEITSGAFDPTVSPLVNAWGFGFTDKMSLTNARIDSLKSITGFKRVSINNSHISKEIPEIQFDFNAIAKGYAADLAGLLLEKHGLESYMVEIGGDLVARGLKPDGTGWRIGLEKPSKNMYESQEWAFLVEMHDKAVATSGSYRKYYEEGGQRFSHTIDPQTGRPVNHNLLSVSVFADDCMTADALATAFMVMGFEKSKEFVESRSDLQAFFIFSTGIDTYDTYTTPGLKVIPRAEVEAAQQLKEQE
jgi:FAD:protein FMN transferase